VKQGIVVDSGERRKTSLGQEAIVWVTIEFLKVVKP
jgi:hypothetical protein